MKLLKGEEILWESKNKKLLLTTHRLREIQDSFLSGSIKSIMLEEITAAELNTNKDFSYLRRAFVYFLSINGIVYLLNQFLFKAELMKFFFGELYIGPRAAATVFYISLFVMIVFIGLFLFSFKRMFSFHAVGMSLHFQLRWLDFEERENFISMVEEAKEKRKF